MVVTVAVVVLVDDSSSRAVAESSFLPRSYVKMAVASGAPPRTARITGHVASSG
jgi:hypothetical protein